MSLFDLSPKATRRALYGRDSQLKTLIRLVDQRRWALILGPRMVGKTSLAKSAAAQSRRPSVYVNLWGANGTAGMLKALLDGINASKPLVKRLLDAFRRVEGVNVAGTGITLTPRPRPLRTVSDLVKVIGEEAGRTVVILDEVQELASVSGALLKVLGNVFNTHPDIVFVFTGSYFGVLRTLLEPPADSPLFGRSPARIQLEPFDRETSIGFLERGFQEYRLRSNREAIGSLVDRSLDGIPGWLTLYGNNVAVHRMTPEVAERATVQEAKTVARSELVHFLEPRDALTFWAALRKLTTSTSWTELREALSAKRGSPMNDHSVGTVIRALRDANLIAEWNHQYSIRDPMIRAFVRESSRAPG
ncbi:MAG: ATP-binding protein [Thermoplasmata archaeon]|nr:ATP-binding protein [Thermoplasmata archaeon]